MQFSPHQAFRTFRMHLIFAIFNKFAEIYTHNFRRRDFITALENEEQKSKE